MYSMSTSASRTRLPLRVETREEYLRPLLRGGETWDELLRAMAEQYDPEKRDRTDRRT